MPIEMHKNPYRISIQIRDIGDEPLTLFVIGIAQRPIEQGNARLISWHFLRDIIATVGGLVLINEVREELEQERECTIGNFHIWREPCSDSLVAEIIEWLAHSSKKANQSDGLKRAFRERTTGMRGPHIRWHEKRGVVKSGCEFCNSAQTSS